MSIHCPKCGGETISVDSRTIEMLNNQYRMRECKKCKRRFVTLESVVGDVREKRKYQKRKEVKGL